MSNVSILLTIALCQGSIALGLVLGIILRDRRH